MLRGGCSRVRNNIIKRNTITMDHAIDDGACYRSIKQNAKEIYTFERLINAGYVSPFSLENVFLYFIRV